MTTLLLRTKPSTSNLFRSFPVRSATPRTPARARFLNRSSSIFPKSTQPSSFPLPLPLLFSTSRHSYSTSSSTLPTTPGSLTNRLRTLFRTHGWTALTIYLFLSLADFSLTFLLIYLLGAEKVREAEDWVLDALGWRRKSDGSAGRMRQVVEGWKDRRSHVEHGLIKEHKELEEKGTKGEKEKEKGVGWATTAVLAYAIHKTALLPVRVGITIGITPRIVRTLRAWGWNVGNAQQGVKVAVETGKKVL